jgi:hypothetical protein
MSLEEMIEELNPLIRGWNSYHMRVRVVVKRRIKSLNVFIRERLRIFLKRKYADPSRGRRRVPGNLFVRLGLYQFG